MNGHARHWIDGAWLDSAQRGQSFDPASGQPIGTYADGGRAEADAAIAAAVRAFEDGPWKDDHALRATALEEIAAAFERHADALIDLLALENGKIKPEAAFEVGMVPGKLRYYAGLARSERGASGTPRPNVVSLVLREPMGVAGIIVPWNSPVVLMIRSLAPALAAGTTTVVKMPGQTAQTNALVARIIAEAPSLPAGAVNIFSESGSEGARRLIDAAEVPVISFTGSSATGRAISAAGARHLKRFGLNSGINLGLWRLRHQSNYTYSRYNGQARRKWNSIRTYAQRALPAWRSELTAGESYTAGNLLGSIGYRGLSLATDDRMLPESLRRYAPQVRGTAATAARVVISQNGRKIREVNVAPGPFVIDDLYDSAYAGDLDVQVFEADGSVSSFSVPFASVPESMRPGLSRYSFTLGQARQYGDGDDLFADFTYQRGMSNALTANLGLRVADDYLAMLGGGVLATRFGAFGLNSTYSSARVEDGARKQGWRIGLDYSRTFQPTGTTLTLAGYRYSTEGYRELGDVLGSRDALRHGDTWDSGSYKQRNQFNLLVSQALGGYGNLYLSGSSSDFYDGKSRDTQLQFGYSNTWGQLSYNLAWSRQTTTYYQEQGDQDPGVELLRRDRRSGQRNDTLTLSVSMPLGSSSRAPTLSAMATRRSGDSRGGSLQTGLNGTLGDERTWSYALSANRDSEVADTTWNGTLQKQAALATVNAGYAQGDRYRQYSGGIRGALVAHRDGLTLGPSVGDTFALVEAKGASGAAIRGGQGARIDGNGYALAPSLSPYRYNPISLDPVGIDPDAELLETERKVAPYAGASVRVTFRTLTGHPLLIQARREDGSVLPLGAVVVDDGGAAIGMVGQGGQVYARAENQRGRLLVQWGTARKERCELPYDLAGVSRDQALIRLRGTCRAATTDSNLENAR
ncbi:TPA: aldehyde dehydrogenase family protein [Pseudomonas aeruginosa]|nr:aldehyde dehydrogenase family protein [Pseudomonas aeruginosa]